ncbi:O-methyltransferase [Nocardioides speluncae]|uniref:O-methyltransferase n=1 Tax=Nocardioides speluncae TaxID=2670337 RepID=UPI000D686B72|nr:O-methyltransferase [Nocardioides speluncae]
MTKSAPPWMDPDLAAYVDNRTTQPDEAQQKLIDRTHAETGGAANMQVSSAQGALLTILTRAAGTKKALEIGTFTGYSSICIARGLADGGSLTCLDVSEEWTAIAREAWAQAGVDDRIELKIAPALETLASLPQDASYDLVFIDADKENYPNYVDAVLPLLRQGGLLLVDNTLWSGDVVRPAEEGSTTAVIQAFNDRLAADERFESYILPISDGMTVAVKR